MLFSGSWRTFLSHMYFLLEYIFLVNYEFICSFGKLLNKYHVLGPVLEVWDKEVIKTSMVPGFCRMHGSVGRSILNTSFHCSEEKCLGNVTAGTKLSGDIGEVSLRKYFC